jgi:hydrogenase maturation protease
VILVVAYGNPMRGDDAVAWRLADAVPRRPDVEVLCMQQLVPELALAVSRAEAVLFLDARADGIPGEIQVEVVAPVSHPAPFGHGLRPGDLVPLAARLGGRAPRAFIVTVSGESFALGADLSAPVRAALPAAGAAVRSLLRRLERRADRRGASTPEAQPER